MSATIRISMSLRAWFFPQHPFNNIDLDHSPRISSAAFATLSAYSPHLRRY